MWLARGSDSHLCRSAHRLPCSPSQLKDLILKLLVTDPRRRLGCLRGGAEDIKQHRFFRAIDFPGLVAKRVQAPWRPTLSGPLDTSYFDQYDEGAAGEGEAWARDF
jgi:hypothetical protein